MKELTKKVVILNNFTSPYVSQAIIVLKDYNPKLEGKALEDAELIVSRYIEKLQKNERPLRVARKKGRFLKVFAITAIIAVFCVAIKYLTQII